MQAILNQYQKSVTGLNFYDDAMLLINKLTDADNALKNEIENKIVKLNEAGEGIVDFLVNLLPDLKGVQRGVVAMSLIRIGEPAVKPLKERAIELEDFGWVANYLISEINA